MKRVLLASLALTSSLAFAELQVPDDIRAAVEADILVCIAYEDEAESKECVDEVVAYHSFQWEVRHRHEEAEKQRELERQQEAQRQSMASQWELERILDPLTDKDITILSLKSDNTFRFRFPYNDDNHLILQLRKHPRYGEDIIIQLVDGQLACYTTDCKVQFRIDGGSLIEAQGLRPDSGNSSLIFIRDRDRNRLWNSLLNAESILISATVFRVGNPIFEFTVKQ